MYSVVQWHQFFFPPFFFWWCAKNCLPKKGVPFFSRGTEQLSVACNHFAAFVCPSKSAVVVFFCLVTFGVLKGRLQIEVLGCFSKPCWLQNIRVGVDDSNSVASLAKVGVYLSDGTLVASSQARDVPTSLPDHQWLAFAFRGHDKELRTTSEQDYVWLVVNTENSVKLTYENADSGDEATRTVSELFAGAFVAVRIWDTEPGRRQWAGHFRNLRVQMDLGDVSILPGTLPLILESPHGGRITEGWPTRVTGVLDSDRNTDLFTEELWSELGARCGRTPVAVIFRVARKGIDANRATGSGTHTRGGELCADQSNSQCCCNSHAS